MAKRDTTRDAKVAVITGGGRGIGAAIAERLAQLKMDIVLCGRTAAPLQATAAKVKALGVECLALTCDVADLHSVESAARAVQERFGACHVLVNNAGVGAFGVPLHKMDPRKWDEVLNTNLRGVFYCIRSFHPLMAPGSHIINISSLAGKNPVPNSAAYAASKWGLNGLSYTVVEELRGQDIRVSVVCPGSVDTELSPHAGKDKNKILQAADIAHVVAALVTQAPQSFISEVLIRPKQK